jgi:hypothetical protein
VNGSFIRLLDKFSQHLPTSPAWRPTILGHHDAQREGLATISNHRGNGVSFSANG